VNCSIHVLPLVCAHILRSSKSRTICDARPSAGLERRTCCRPPALVSLRVCGVTNWTAYSSQSARDDAFERSQTRNSAVLRAGHLTSAGRMRRLCIGLSGCCHAYPRRVVDTPQLHVPHLIRSPPTTIQNMTLRGLGSLQSTQLRWPPSFALTHLDISNTASDLRVPVPLLVWIDLST
jgi:hypothetical protein